MLLRAIVFFALAAVAQAQTGPANADFEKGTPGVVPEGWFVPGAFQHYRVSWVGEGCRQGKGCVELAPGPNSAANPGNLMQMFNAAPYRGKMFRYRAAVNVASGAHAGLWFRVDRPGGRMGFFDNMAQRPIRTDGNWEYFEIDGFVHADAMQIALGVLAYEGTVRLDDVSLAITGDLPKSVEEPARPLTAGGLRNMVAFAKLFGIVRHFHPSDEAAVADWDLFAIEAVRKVEAAASPVDLAAALQAIFVPVAPTIRVYGGTTPPHPHAALTPGDRSEIIRLQNKGFGFNTTSIYQSRRVKSPATTWRPDDVFPIDLGEGVKALVPLALFTDEKGTLPHAAGPIEKRDSTPPTALSGNDRATRIAGVVIAWNVLLHFYPYFDVVKTDWNAVLPGALSQAAIDRNDLEFHNTLMKMVAELKDGHGRVTYSGQIPMARPPILAGWIDNKYIVTAAADSAADRVKPGDEIVAIGGKPSAEVLEAAEKLISGATPQWKRARSVNEVLMAPRGEELALTVRPYHSAETKEVRLLCVNAASLLPEPRPKSVVAELEPSIWYVDLTRAVDKDFEEALPKLALAKGIVFDMRGYPRVGVGWFSHLSRTPLRSAQWHVPLVNRPGEMIFEQEGEWNLPPKEPYLAVRKVFLTNGGAISYAESTMGIVEYYKLGEIVGEATAGTNGNVNPFVLPGGYNISWTGMKVLKQDGSQHHGVGIQPTVRAMRTQSGVAAGRDEVLERGVALLK